MTATASVRIGTRGSRLALAQAGIAARAVAGSLGGSEIVAVSTRGDVISASRPRAATPMVWRRESNIRSGSSGRAA